MIRPERVQAAFETWKGKPELGPNATAMFEYIIHLEAEIVRLAADLRNTEEISESHVDTLIEAKAEIERLTEENAELKEFDLTKPDAEWREIYDDQLKRTGFFSGQLTATKAEIARLLTCLHQPNPTNPNEWRIAPGKGAEFSRAIAALKPDTGEKP